MSIFSHNEDLRTTFSPPPTETWFRRLCSPGSRLRDDGVGAQVNWGGPLVGSLREKGKEVGSGRGGSWAVVQAQGRSRPHREAGARMALSLGSLRRRGGACMCQHLGCRLPTKGCDLDQEGSHSS